MTEAPPAETPPQTREAYLLALLKNAAEGISFLGLSIHERRMPSQASWEGLSALLDAINKETA